MEIKNIIFTREMDIDGMESRLNKISSELKKEDQKMKETIQKIADKDETKQSYEYLSEEERNYRKVNDAYKKYISQYSKESIDQLVLDTQERMSKVYKELTASIK